MEKITLNVKNLAREVADLSELKNMKKTQKDVREVLELVSEIVEDYVGRADENTDVEVKILPGLSVISSHKPERIARNPMTGDLITVTPRNSVRAKIFKCLKVAANK